VAPLFHYVEKDEENDAAIFCSVSATLFLLRQAGNEISWLKFHEILYISRYEILVISQFEISQNKHKNFAKYEMNYFAKFHRLP
jgi:hypothetical protein